MFGQRRLAWLVGIALLGPAMALRAGEAEKYFPSDTNAVVTFNIKQILDSGVVKPDLGKLQQAMKGVDGLEKALTDLGFDPMKDLESVTMAAVGADDQEKAVVIVRGKFNVAKFKAAAAAEAKKEKGFKAVKGDYAIYEVDMPGQPLPAFVGMVDGSTIVLSPRKEFVTEAFEVKAGKKKPAVKKELQDLLAKSDAKQSISITALGSALGNNVPFGDKVENIHGGISLADDLQADIVIQTKDAESAKGLASFLNDHLDMAKQIVLVADLLNNLKVTEKGNAVNLKGQFSKESIEKLRKGL